MSDISHDDLTEVMAAFDASGATQFSLRCGTAHLSLRIPMALTPVVSPSVGYFHPVAFADAQVAAGETLARIRTLGNQFDVTAPVSGRLTAWLVPDGDLTGYGASLAHIEAAE